MSEIRDTLASCSSYRHDDNFLTRLDRRAHQWLDSYLWYHNRISCRDFDSYLRWLLDRGPQEAGSVSPPERNPFVRNENQGELHPHRYAPPVEIPSHGELPPFLRSNSLARDLQNRNRRQWESEVEGGRVEVEGTGPGD